MFKLGPTNNTMLCNILEHVTNLTLNITTVTTQDQIPRTKKFKIHVMMNNFVKSKKNIIQNYFQIIKHIY